MAALREAVDFAIETDDISSLIRLLYYWSARPSNLQTQQQFADDRSDQNGATESPEEATANNTQKSIEDAVTLLHGIASARAAEVSRAYQANTADIDTAVNDFGSITQLSTDLQRQFKEVEESLTQITSSLEIEAQRQQSSRIAAARIADTRTLVSITSTVLQRCSMAAKHIEAGALLTAVRLIEDTEAQSSNIDPSLAIGQHIRRIVSSLSEALEQQALADLNTWLANARAKARAVGEYSIGLADATWQRQEQRSASCLTLTQQFLELSTSTAAGAATSSVKMHSISHTDALDQLRRQIEEDAAVDLSSATASDSPAGSASLCGLDMALLHRSAYILCRRPNGKSNLLERYYSSRNVQLAADLAPSDDMLENYRALLATATGHFVIEDRANATVEGLESSSHLSASWEGCAAALSAVLRAAMEEADAHGVMLGLKEVAVLCCEAIDNCHRPEFDSSVLKEAVLGKASRFRESLAENATDALQTAQGDVLQIKKLAERIAMDARAFLIRLLPPERLEAACIMETELVLATALEAERALRELQQQQHGQQRGINALSSALNAIKEARAIQQALSISETSVSNTNKQGMRPSNITSSTSYNTTRTSPLAAALQRAEAQAAAAVSTTIQLALYDACSATKWTPAHMPKTGGTCSQTFIPVAEVLRHQQRLLLAVDSMDSAVVGRILFMALEESGKQLLNILASDVVSGFNLYGLQQLLSDLRCLEHSIKPSIDDSGEEAKAPQPQQRQEAALALQEPILFCELVVFGTVRELLDGEVRSSKYKVLDMDRCIALLTKINDLPAGAAQQGKALTKKVLDGLIKDLRRATTLSLNKTQV